MFNRGPEFKVLIAHPSGNTKEVWGIEGSGIEERCLQHLDSI